MREALITRRGTPYAVIHLDGKIERLDGHFGPSETWRIAGAVTRNNLGGVERWWTLAEILADPNAIPWRFKNGKQRTYLRDLDHGSAREWRNPPHAVMPRPR